MGFVFAGLIGAIVALVLCAPVASATDGQGRYIVFFENSVDDAPGLARAQTKQRHGRLGFIYQHGFKGYSAELPERSVEALRRDPRVISVSRDQVVESAAQTTPTGISRIFAPGNSNIDIDGVDDAPVNVDVAVLDTGIDASHPDLDVVSSVDCSKDFTTPICEDGGTDTEGHGTHVAGTIGAIDNGQGVIGVAPSARLWSIKTLGTGTNRESEYIAGVHWINARASQIEVANLSVQCEPQAGQPPCRFVNLEFAIGQSTALGVVYVAAAGNYKNGEGTGLGGTDAVLNVSGLADYDGLPGGKASPPPNCQQGLDDRPYVKTNFGPSIDVAAPGACIYSTWTGGGYAVQSGTSMAAPHVAGAAAILASRANPQNKADVKAIQDTIKAEGNFNWEDTSGDGIQEPLLDLSDTTVFDAVNVPRWRVQPYNEDPKGGLDSWLEDVSCVSAIDCFAVGYSGMQPLVKRWNGKGWSLQTAKPPSTAVETKLEGISCTSASHCVAVGTYREASGEWHTLAMLWNGSAWAEQGTPTPTTEAGTDRGYLRDVSCTSESACVAVGVHHYQISPGNEWQRTMALHWDGKKWTMITAPQAEAPPNPSATYNDLQAVSCDSATTCMATGFYYDNAVGQWKMLATRWTGTAWENKSPTSTESLSQFYAVSCTSADACTAVGMQRDGWGVWRSLAARWSGPSAGWAFQTVPKPGHAGETPLQGVSCTSPTACTATGWRTGSDQKPLAVRWDGSVWEIQPTPKLTEEGNGNTRLNSVSCVHPKSCVSVGFYRPASIGLSLALQFQNGPPTTPYVGTGTPSGGKGRLEALINPNGSDTTYQFEWGSTAAYGNKVPAVPQSIGAGFQDVGVGDWIEGLLGSSTYHYRLVVTNAEGTFYGQDRTFGTGNWKPQVIVKPATNIGVGKATLEGRVYPASLPTTYQFEWGPTTSYGSSIPLVPKSVGSEASWFDVAETIEGLTGSNTYNFRIKATNAEGTIFSPNQPFATPNWKPAAITKAASNVGQYEATLNGTVNPRGFATTYYFEYGPTTAYGQKIPLSPKAVGSGTGDIAVAEVVKGLSSYTTYHYRLVAQNGEGTSNGADQVLTTKPATFNSEFAGNLTGKGVGSHTFTAGSPKVTCTTVSYSGQMPWPKSESVTVAPAYSSCTAVVFGVPVSVTIDMGGCAFQHSIAGSVTISGATCAADPISYSMSYSAFACTVTIGPQTIGGVSYKAEGVGSGRSVSVTGSLTSLKYTTSGPICTKVGTFADGTYLGNENLTAVVGASTPQGFWVQ
jgi:subtilisin family serine protease